MFHTKVGQKIETHTVCVQQGFSFFKSHTGYLIWKNGVQQGRQHDNIAPVHGMLYN
jgi:hypothetical protein